MLVVVRLSQQIADRNSILRKCHLSIHLLVLSSSDSVIFPFCCLRLLPPSSATHATIHDRLMASQSASRKPPSYIDSSVNGTRPQGHAGTRSEDPSRQDQYHPLQQTRTPVPQTASVNQPDQGWMLFGGISPSERKYRRYSLCLHRQNHAYADLHSECFAKSLNNSSWTLCCSCTCSDAWPIGDFRSIFSSKQSQSSLMSWLHCTLSFSLFWQFSGLRPFDCLCRLYTEARLFER